MNLQQLMQNPYVFLVSTTCTVAAFVFTICTWYIGKRKKEISYSKVVYEMIRAGKSFVPGFRMLYMDKEIENLTVTRFAIWNSGNEILRCDDIVKAEPFRIECEEGKTKILNAEILKHTEEANAFEIKELNEKMVSVTFDYVGEKEGIILQVLHTGSSASLNASCKIKGGKQLKRIRVDSGKSRKSKKRETMIITTMILGCGVIMMMVLCVSLLSYGYEYAVSDPQGYQIFAETNRGWLALKKMFLGLTLSLVAIDGVLCVMLSKDLWRLSVPIALRSIVDE